MCDVGIDNIVVNLTQTQRGAQRQRKAACRRPSSVNGAYQQSFDANNIKCLVCDTSTDYRNLRYMPHDEPYRSIFLDDLDTTETMKTHLVDMLNGNELDNKVTVPVCTSHFLRKPNIRISSQKIRSLATLKPPSIELLPEPGRLCFADFDKKGERVILLAFPAALRANTSALETALDNILNKSSSRINDESTRCAVMDMIRSYVVDYRRIGQMKIDGVNVGEIMVKVLGKMSLDAKMSWQRILFDVYPYQLDGRKLLIPLDPKICPYLYHPSGMIRDIGGGHLLPYLRCNDQQGYPIICLSNSDVGGVFGSKLVSNSMPNKFIFRPAGFTNLDKLFGAIVVINERDLNSPWRVHKPTSFVHANFRPVAAFRRHLQPILSEQPPRARESPRRGPVPNGDVKPNTKRPYNDRSSFNATVSSIIDPSLTVESVEVETGEAPKKHCLNGRLPSLPVVSVPLRGSPFSKGPCTPPFNLSVDVIPNTKTQAMKICPIEPLEFQNPLGAQGESLSSNIGRTDFVTSLPSRVNSRMQLVEEKPMEQLVEYKDLHYRPHTVDRCLVNLIDTKKASLCLDEKQRLFEAVNERLFDNEISVSSIARNYQIGKQLIVELAEMTVNRLCLTQHNGCFAPRSYDAPKIYTRLPTRENWDDLWILIAKAIRSISLKYLIRTGREIRVANALMECVLFGTPIEQASKKYIITDQWCFHQLYFSILREKEGKGELLRLIRAKKYLLCVRGGIVRDETQAGQFETCSLPIKSSGCRDVAMSLKEGVSMISELLVDPKTNNRMKLIKFSGNKERLCSEIDNIFNYMAVPYWMRNSMVRGILEMLIEQTPVDQISTDRSIGLNVFLLLSCMVRTFIPLDKFNIYKNIYIGPIYRPKSGFKLVNEETFSLVRLTNLKKFCFLEQLTQPKRLAPSDQMNAVDLLTASVETEGGRMMEGEQCCSSWEVNESDEADEDWPRESESTVNWDCSGLSALQLMSNIHEDAQIKEGSLEEEEIP